MTSPAKRIVPSSPVLEPLEPRLLLSGTAEDQALQLFNLSPALFVENQGQWADETVHYVHNGSGANVAMTDEGIEFQVFRPDQADSSTNNDPAAGPGLHDRFDPETHQNQMLQFSASFLGGNPVTPTGLQPSETLLNYFIGDQVNWREGVAAYEIVAYENLYPGIDLLTQGLRSNLKYEFHVAPGADASAIRVHYNGISGLSLADDGSLIVNLGADWGALTDDAPFIYQTIDGQQVAVAGDFVLVDDSTYSFQVTGPYDPNRELVLDPDLAWSTYLGGSDTDYGYDIDVDSSGNTLVTGSTRSSGWVSGGFDTSFNPSTDAFVVKLSPSGGHLWSTYLGGIDYDGGHGIAVDPSGNVFMTGWTYSFGWVSGGFDTSYNGDADAFVAKLSPSGGHLWSTYLGGSGDDRGYDIALDSSDNALVTGGTGSSGWVLGGFDTSYNGNDYDAFVAKLSPSGGHLWSTYLGGSNWDFGCGIAVDPSSSVLVTGYTYSSDWVSGGFDTSYNGGGDAFVAKLSPSGGHFWSTYLGGSSGDDGYGIAVDPSGNALVTGDTASSGWVSGGFDTSGNGGNDAFVAKLSPSGGHVWSTYLGGSDHDWGYGIAADPSGSVLVTGATGSTDFSGRNNTYKGGYYDAFVAKVASSGSLLWATYLGGSGNDGGWGIALDPSGSIFVTGSTWSSGWVSGGFDTSYNGGEHAFAGDAFVAKLAPGLPADANHDGKVDSADLAIWQRNYDPLGLHQNTFEMGNWDGDGDVDSADLAIWQRNYNPLGLSESLPLLQVAANDSLPTPLAQPIASAPDKATVTSSEPLMQERIVTNPLSLTSLSAPVSAAPSDPVPLPTPMPMDMPQHLLARPDFSVMPIVPSVLYAAPGRLLQAVRARSLSHQPRVYARTTRAGRPAADDVVDVLAAAELAVPLKA